MPRLRLAFAAALALTALAAGPAGATTLVLPDGTVRPQPYQSWVDASRVPTPPGVVTLHVARCPFAAWAGGCVVRGTRAVYLAPTSLDRRTLLHELGHIYDQTVMTPAARLRFQRLVRRGAWAAAAGGDSAEEQFAEAYAMCARRTRIRRAQFGMYDYAPTPRRHERACRIIAAAAA